MNWKKKLSSRKLWAAVVGVVVGIAAAFGIEGNEYAEVAGIITSAISVAAYIFGESRIDAAASVPIIIPETTEESEDDGAEMGAEE